MSERLYAVSRQIQYSGEISRFSRLLSSKNRSTRSYIGIAKWNSPCSMLNAHKKTYQIDS